jgi:hypothetical protein
MAGAFSKKVREEILSEYRAKYPERKPSVEGFNPTATRYSTWPPR